jgi:hypothetical protein
MLPEVEGAIGVKITADNLAQAVAGSEFFLITNESEEEYAKEYSLK